MEIIVDKLYSRKELMDNIIDNIVMSIKQYEGRYWREDYIKNGITALDVLDIIYRNRKEYHMSYENKIFMLDEIKDIIPKNSMIARYTYYNGEKYVREADNDVCFYIHAGYLLDEPKNLPKYGHLRQMLFKDIMKIAQEDSYFEEHSENNKLAKDVKEFFDTYYHPNVYEFQDVFFQVFPNLLTHQGLIEAHIIHPNTLDKAKELLRGGKYNKDELTSMYEYVLQEKEFYEKLGINGELSTSKIKEWVNKKVLDEDELIKLLEHKLTIITRDEQDNLKKVEIGDRHNHTTFEQKDALKELVNTLNRELTLQEIDKLKKLQVFDFDKIVKNRTNQSELKRTF